MGSGGNVGIGTTSPGAKFVVQTNPLTGFYTQSRVTDFFDGVTAGSEINGYADNSGAFRQLGAIRFGMDDGSADPNLKTSIRFLTVHNSSLGERVRIDNIGNVGIGTTAPGAKLEVAGNINSSTGALQTAGVTRIDNSGVGTFAAGTTIGGSGIPGGAGLNSLQTFTSSGTWTKPSGVTKVIVEVQGSGGGGGGGGGAGGDGGWSGYGGQGGAGGYCKKLINVSAVSSVAVTIGSAGSGGGGTYGGGTGGTGTTGGATSFGAYCTANGGAGGTGSWGNSGGAGSGGAGGSSSG